MLLNLLFPHKCVLCRKVLTEKEIDIGNDCRKEIPEFSYPLNRIPFVEGWTALWYYKDDVRDSIHRFKFGNRRHYAEVYGRLLALRLNEGKFAKADLVTWVPVSALRKFKRGYDQSSLLAKALGKELSLPVTRALKKIRHTPPQSTLGHAPQRRANVLGAYKITDTAKVAGKRVLLLDDVLTTGATASECAKVLLTAGAKEVLLATIAVAKHDKKK